MVLSGLGFRIAELYGSSRLCDSDFKEKKYCINVVQGFDKCCHDI